MIAKSFAFADEEFLSVILKNYTVLNYESLDYESRCRVLFTKCWDYLMAHPNELTFYVRYYYSISFQKYAYTEHMARYKNLFEKNGWEVSTADGLPSAQWEIQVLVTEDGHEVISW